MAELEAAAQNELQRLKTLQVRLTPSERRFEEEPVLERTPEAMGLAYALCARRRAAEVRLMKTRSTMAHRLRDVGRYRDAMSGLEEARAVFDAAPETPAQIAHIEHRMVVIYQHLGQPERAPALLVTEHAGLEPGLAMMRLVHRADSLRWLGGDGLPLMRQALAVIPDPNDNYYGIASLFMTWLAAARVFEALGRTADARRAADTGRDGVMAVHDRRVPEVFRHSFLQRNPVNHELLARAARLTAS